LPKTTFRTKIGGAGLGQYPKNVAPLRISATVEASNFKFGTQLGFGSSLPKTTFWTKIGGSLSQGSIQKRTWDRYIFLQPLKLATSNLAHKLGLGLAYQKRRLKPKLAKVWLGKHSQKIWDPLRISATVEASNFKFDTQLGFGTSLPKNNVLDQNWRGSEQQKLGTPYLFLQPLKLTTSNLVHNLGLVLAYQKTTFRGKLAGVWAKGASKKMGPQLISATVEASNFRFGTQIGFGTSLPKNDV